MNKDYDRSVEVTKMLKKFVICNGEINPYKKWLAEIFKEEIEDKHKGSYTWACYQLCNVISDEDLKEYGVYLTEVVGDLEDLIDDYNDIVAKEKM